MVVKIWYKIGFGVKEWLVKWSPLKMTICRNNKLSMTNASESYIVGRSS